ncbi:MAG: hypothetical protein WAN72_14015 [Candidatus Acidiferrales bacterium]
MKKAMMCGVTILVVAMLAWAGGDPWKTKPYQQWTDEDIQKVFTASPWSQKVAVEGTWKPVRGVDSANGSLNAGGGGGAKGMGGSSTVLPAEADVNAGTRGPSVPFNVYWMSSETMRAALGRRSVLHAGKNETDVDKYVETPVDEYQIVVQGLDMAPFYHNEEKFFEVNSALEVKKTKQKFSPSHVAYNRDDKGAITSAVFFFPKKLNGQDTISASDKSVEFTCRLGNSTLHAVFEPTKMVNQKGADL